jgi:hypothetical protein
VRLYLEGANFRRIGRILGVNYQSVINWINSYHVGLPAAEQPAAAPETLEVDELFTFVGSKKRPAYVVTVVERSSRCILAWAVCEARTPELMQSVVDAAPHARNYYSDAFGNGVGGGLFPREDIFAHGKITAGGLR